MNSGRFYRRTSALLLTLFIIATTTSCGNVDEFVDKAGNVLEDVGDVARDVGGVVKDAIDEHGESTSSGEDSGGQTVSRPPRPTGTLSTGTETPLVTETVSPSGGTVTVDKQGDPLNGLEINVPAGAYPDSRQFAVSSAPVDGHTFGENFTPATPLISIDNGGEYSEEFMTVRIPVDIPPDHFAMAFYYDDAAGTLEGIPFNGMDEQSITIVTRHFCSLLVSIIRNTVLDDLMKGDIDSHFRPGIDDWQFTNRSSYIARDGHCAGQSISAMWYFCEQPDGQDLTLNGRYDNNGRKPSTPDFWMDDSYGYRLASTVQRDVDFDSFSTKLQVSLRGTDDELQFKAFAYAIQITGEPQYAGITSNAGGGHAMVAYRVHDNHIYIADPNYPGNTERRIEYSDGSFKPYNSGANADEIAAGRGKAYENIGFMAKSSAIDWDSIGVRWNEFKSGTIGNDRFPPYTVMVANPDYTSQPLVDGFVSEQKMLGIFVLGPPRTAVFCEVYRSGTKIAPSGYDEYELQDGNNLLGIAILGYPDNGRDISDQRYVDFQYFNVQYGEQQECHGWVLDSVDVVQDYGGINTQNEEYVQPLQHDDGHYSYSVRQVVRDNHPGQPGGEVYAAFTNSGSWGPLPACLAPDEPLRVDLQMATSVQPPSNAEAPDWDGQRFTLDCNMTGRLDQTVTRGTPALDESTVVEFSPFGEGTASFQSVSIEVQLLGFVEFTYRYNYVWRG